MAEHDDSVCGHHGRCDGRRQMTERVGRERRRLSMARQVRDQPAPEPPRAQYSEQAVPHVASRALTVEQEQEWLTAAAVLNMQRISQCSRMTPRLEATPRTIRVHRTKARSASGLAPAADGALPS